MYVEVIISNTDVRLTNWLKTVFGGAIHAGKRNRSQWAPCFHWYVTSKRAAEILAGCLDYFIIKRDQADIALAFQNTIVTDRRYGCKGRPTELLDQQTLLANQLRSLKGTSSRSNRSQAGSTIQ